MASYRIVFKRSVAKDLRRLPEKDIQSILRRITELADEPRPAGVVKLAGGEMYRIRQGDYRVVYAIADDVITVTIIRVRHRRDVYR